MGMEAVLSQHKIFITGASGFIGRILCSRLLAQGRDVRGALLSGEDPSLLVTGVEPAVIEPLGPDACWGTIISGVETIIHLAARVHIMHETAADPLSEFRKINTVATADLARQAANQGVKRFVFMSTIGVNGDNSGEKRFTSDDKPNPHNNYSVSKYEAEQLLLNISGETGMEVVIIRAPLVYGPGSPGNFLSLLNIVSKGIPLPFASVNNRRSLIYVGNLVDALATCATHPAAPGNTYLVSDGDDVSTPELLQRTAAALGVPARLFPFPVSLLRVLGKITGKSGAVNQLTGSLTVDSTRISRELGWHAPHTMQDGLRETAGWFKPVKNAR